MNSELLMQQIRGAYMFFGQQVPTDRAELLESIKTHLRDRFTDAEIGYVFTQGKKGQYTDLKFISPAEICKWFDAFVMSGQQAKIFPKIMIPEKAQLTEKEKEQIVYNGLCEKFEFYKSTGTIRDPGSVSCRFLFSKEKIKLSEKQISEFMDQAKHNIVMNYELQMKLTDKDRILKEVAEGDCTEQKSEASRLALKDYFDKLIAMDMSIDDIFNGEF